MPRELVVVPDIAGEAVRRFIEAAPRSVVLSGGSTPAPVYARLAEIDYPWRSLSVFFGDERCVPPDGAGSNYGMAYEQLLSRVPATAYRMDGEGCAADGYERLLAEMFGPGLPSFDLVFLGLGADGHTASIFPGSPAMEERTRRVVRVERPDYARLTLTLPVLSAARLAIFLVAGASKREALARLIRGDDIPAARVAAARVVIIADEAAGGGLA